jgi:mono/diheme cytochrome c family protein
VPFDRQGYTQPAQDRTAVPDTAQALPIETLSEALAEGISTGHPTMPAFQLDPDQIGDLLAYLKTLE